MWIAIAIVAAIALLLSWRGPNATWGGIVLGGIAGLIWAMISKNLSLWPTIGKGIVVGILLGFVADLIGKVADRARQKARIQD